MNIFDFLYPKYKINKPIKLIQLFAGYGSQALALKYLGVPFTHHRICEWAIPSIIAYCDLHITNKKEFCGDLTKEQIVYELYNYGVSIDYNKPATLNQLKRMPESKLRLTYNSILNSNNLVDITKVKGRDLGFTDGEVIMTYSFPCQDLSLAGLGKGMKKGSGTRSGLLWEVERILAERERENLPLPKILLMENVPQVINKQNVDDFNKWQLRLEQFGYKNYHQLLNAKDYGIPQNRNRCFMVSILGDYSYSFPKKQKLKLRLKDLLEKDVDEKYYLSEKMIKYVINRTPLGEKGTFANNIIGKDANKNSGTITTKNSDTGTTCRGEDTFIVDNMTQDENDKNIYLKIKNATKKGYLEAEDGDGVDISGRMESHRGTVQKGLIQTLDTQCNQGVVVDVSNHTNKLLKEELCDELIENGEVKEGDIVNHSRPNNPKVGEDGVAPTITTRGDELGVTVVDLKRGYSCEVKDEAPDSDDIDVVGNYSKSGYNATPIVGKNGIAPTVMENHGSVTSILDKDNYIQWQEKGRLDIDCRAYKEDKIAPTTTTPKTKIINNLRIRKLTPLECWRLMGVKDEDYEKVKTHQSESSLYHLAGDSIVVNVLMEIFKMLLKEEK